ncbi:MAG: hypothetical protein Crog4KO_18870 [Crocinitomicaceae bacterium]
MHPLKKARRGSPLTLDDTRMLLKQKCWGAISRIESGQRYPTLEMLICYHILFDTPLEDLLHREIVDFRLQLEEKAEVRIDEITQKGNSVDFVERIHFLNQFSGNGAN